MFVVALLSFFNFGPSDGGPFWKVRTVWLYIIFTKTSLMFDFRVKETQKCFGSPKVLSKMKRKHNPL